MTTYRVAILGCRARGTAAARAYAAHPRTEVVALCDLQPDRTDALGEELGVAARYTDLDRMLGEERPDLVVVPTATDLHYELSSRVLEYGAHVDVEKPLCTDLEQADALLARAARAGRRIAVHHQSRVGPPMQAALREIRAGGIGEIRHLQAGCKGYYGGYGAMNIGTHLVTNLFGLAGRCRAVSAVAAVGGKRVTPRDVVEAPGGMGVVLGERITAALELENGATAGVHFHWLPRVDGAAYSIQVLGTEGCLLWTTRAAWRLPTPHFLPDGEHDRWEPLPLETPPGYDPAAKTPDEWAYVEEYVQALDEGRDPLCSGESARHALEVLLGMFEAAAYGRRVPLPQADRSHPLLRWRQEAGLPPPEPGPRAYGEWLEAEHARQAAR